MEVHRILGFDQFRGNSARKSVDFFISTFSLTHCGCCHWFLPNYPLFLHN